MEFDLLKQRSKNLAYEVTEIRHCEDERIAFCGAIQNGGILIVAHDDTLAIRALSANFETYFAGAKAETVLGQSLTNYVNFGRPGITAQEICQRIATGDTRFSINTPSGVLMTATSCYRHNSLITIEFETESAAAAGISSATAVKDLVHYLKSAESVEDACQHAASAIQRISGFDRVMIYRFDTDWNGHVIAESRDDKRDSFLGLKYPASDIPPQARDLFFKNQSRMIIDANADAIPILTHGFHPGELDLSHSILRAVSPIHLQYLSNMGVASSFSAPIRVSDRLWGLIACHHYSGPMHPSHDVRAAFELTAQITSGKVSDLVARRRLQIKNESLLFTQHFLGEVAGGKNALESFRDSFAALLDLTGSSAAYIRIGGEELLVGASPSIETVEAVKQRLKNIFSLSVWASNSLVRDVQIKPDPLAAGVLAVPFSLAFEDCLIWFRPEEVQEVRWGGKPTHKESSLMSTIERLTPRRSFADWTETVENQSRPWSEADEECAQYFLFGFVQGIFSRARALSVAYEELERVAKAKDEFIGTVSHELRTPLGIIVGWIEILKEYPQANNEATEAIEIIDRNARLQISLINDLLDVSRIVSGKLRLNTKPHVDIARLIADIVDGARPTAQSKNIQLQWTQPERFDITADPDRIRQVVWNLLTNALKFTPKDGIVKVSVEKQRSACVIKVSDNGMGIARDQLSRIFERFAQAKASSANLGGLGLGLSIVKTLSELHGGHVEAQSEGEGKGTEFTVSLPIYALKASDIETPVAIEPQRTNRMDGVRVLIAEDQPDSLRALKIMIERNGGSTVGVGDGEQALQALKSQSFDLILSDVGMPLMNGHELMRAWRKEEVRFKIPPIPAIALTAYASSRDRTLALEAGFHSHIPKPVDREELLAVIDSLQLKVRR